MLDDSILSHLGKHAKFRLPERRSSGRLACLDSSERLLDPHDSLGERGKSLDCAVDSGEKIHALALTNAFERVSTRLGVELSKENGGASLPSESCVRTRYDRRSFVRTRKEL